MLLILLLILLLLLIVGLYFLYRLIKWVLKEKIRIRWALTIIVVVALTSIIKIAFFTKMEFIQSKVYPNLYLVKNPIKDKDYIHRIIKKRVLQKVNAKLLDDNGTNEFSRKLREEPPYGISFYEYDTGTFFLIPFGDAGTVHFIKNKEDPGGFSSEELYNYDQFRIAEFKVAYCKSDSLHHTGILLYYQGRDVIKTDTLFNQCIIKKEAAALEDVDIVIE